MDDVVHGSILLVLGCLIPSPTIPLWVATIKHRMPQSSFMAVSTNREVGSA